MNELFKKIFLSVIFCMAFCGLGLIVWASGFWLVDLTGWRIEIFDCIATLLLFCGFLSCCIVNEKNNETDGKS